MQSVSNVAKHYRSIQNLLLLKVLTKFYVTALVSNLTLSLDQGAYILGYICQGYELVSVLGQKCNKRKVPFLHFSGVVVTALIQLLLCCLLLISFHFSYLSYLLFLILPCLYFFSFPQHHVSFSIEKAQNQMCFKEQNGLNRQLFRYFID